jgi:flavin reductase (DIM6/NTAB) family NADH-FMN oxidoreductase RutF
MSKVKIEKVLPPLTLPVCLAGAMTNGKPNFNTIAWFTMLNDTPPLIGLSMARGRYTAKGIRESGLFSVNVPSSDTVAAVDYCGLHSGKTVDKSALFEVFYGDLKTAPMVQACPLTMECRLVRTVDFGGSDFFVGEIVSIYVEESALKNGKPDVEKLDPILFFMPEGPYRKVGRTLAGAWEIGQDYRPAPSRV